MGSVNVHAEERHGALGYAGEISPRDAWEQLKQNKEAVLIDVRTPPEWTFSGEPDLSSIGKEVVKISWRLFPNSALNDKFAETIKSLGMKTNAPLFFLCRSGGRSLDAACAITTEGYAACYNITDGFEGPLDASRHRGTIAGWKASHLPWGQG